MVSPKMKSNASVYKLLSYGSVVLSLGLAGFCKIKLFFFFLLLSACHLPSKLFTLTPTSGSQAMPGTKGCHQPRTSHHRGFFLFFGVWISTTLGRLWRAALLMAPAQHVVTRVQMAEARSRARKSLRAAWPSSNPPGTGEQGGKRAASRGEV